MIIVGDRRDSKSNHVLGGQHQSGNYTNPKDPAAFAARSTARAGLHGACRKTPRFLARWKLALSGAPLERYSALA